MIILFLLVALLFIFISRNPRQSIPRPENDTITDNTADEVNDYSQSYRQKYIFSRNEKTEFRKFASWAKKHEYYIFPKVRLADIIEPRTQSNWRSLFGRIQSRHVDFVICDNECRIKFIIELDDNSHNQQKRIERDIFVDQACRGAGYRVIHTRGISEEFLNNLNN